MMNEMQQILSYFTSKQCSVPRTIIAYANDAGFEDEFWNNISYQTECMTEAYKDSTINVDTFMDTLMRELTKYKDETAPLLTAPRIKLKGKKYYLWLATRMGMATVKDALGLEILQMENHVDRYLIL